MEPTHTTPLPPHSPPPSPTQDFAFGVKLLWYLLLIQFNDFLTIMNNPNNESNLILSNENKLQFNSVIISTSHSDNLDIDLPKCEPYTFEMYKEDQELIDSIYNIKNN